MQLLLVEDFLAQDMFSSNESKGDPFSTRSPGRSVQGSNQKAAFYLRWTRRVGLRTESGSFLPKLNILLGNYGKILQNS